VILAQFPPEVRVARRPSPDPCYNPRDMIAFHGATDVGRRRPINEDAIVAGDGLFVVCDGMGGHKAGEVASKVAIDAIATFVRRSGEDPELTWPYGFDRQSSLDENRLRTAIKLANRTVFRKSTSSDDYSGMGTTVAAALFSRARPRMTYASVGDSRIYLVRGRTIAQLTRDDSWLNAAWDGEPPDESILASMKNVLTKALGAGDDVDFEVAVQELNEGDVVLLCSDGLTNMLSDSEILDVVSARGPDLQGACRDLIAAANARGGRDNISAVLLRYTV
jgi:serine/threonine protein phosphatase PrpC